jgi:type I restriction enzyme R subunit
MSPGAHTERAFEDRVEFELLERAWEQAQGTHRPERGLDTGGLLLRFIGATSKRSGTKLIELHGGDQPAEQRQLAQRLPPEIDARGVLDVLRQGVKDEGVAIDLAYFRPGRALAADALHTYPANVVTVVRQPGPAAARR